MENKFILWTYLASWCLYLVVGYYWLRRKQLNPIVVVLSSLVPSAIAVIISYIFLYKHGETVAQFTVGSEPLKCLLDVWFQLWLTLMAASAGSACVNLIWAIIACFLKEERKWVLIGSLAAMMSLFAFFAVSAYMPDA